MLSGGSTAATQPPGELAARDLLSSVLSHVARGLEFQGGGALPRISAVISSCAAMMRAEPILLEAMSGEFVIVGDVHGNISCLLRIFEMLGYPPERRYVFLGDYVDRGANSVEVLLVLYSLKVLCPECVYLLRGNHEAADMAAMYGFEKECLSKCSSGILRSFLQSFDEMPVAAVVNGWLCLHGGISPSIESVATIRALKKVSDPMDDDRIADILWSDPSDEVLQYEASPRGSGVLFGQLPVHQFLERSNLRGIIRAHQNCQAGFEWPFLESGRILTVFSSCDYCELMNDAAVAILSEDRGPEMRIVPPLLRASAWRRRLIRPTCLLSKGAEQGLAPECRESNLIDVQDLHVDPMFTKLSGFV